jgi:hypothetical protein
MFEARWDHPNEDCMQEGHVFFELCILRNSSLKGEELLGNCH